MQNVWAASNGPHTFYTPLIEASWCSKRGGTRPPRGKALFRSVVRYRSAGGAARARTHRILRALRFDLRCGPRRGGHRRGAEGAAIDSDGSSLAPVAPWRFQKGRGWRCPSSGARRRRSGKRQRRQSRATGAATRASTTGRSDARAAMEAVEACLLLRRSAVLVSSIRREAALGARASREPGA
jgi:hypothetical protein